MELQPIEKWLSLIDHKQKQFRSQSIPDELLLIFCLYLLESSNDTDVKITSGHLYLEILLTQNDWRYLTLSIYAINGYNNVRKYKTGKIFHRDTIQKISKYLAFIHHEATEVISFLTRLKMNRIFHKDIWNLGRALEQLSLNDHNTSPHNISIYISKFLFQKSHPQIEIVVDKCLINPTLHRDISYKYIMGNTLTILDMSIEPESNTENVDLNGLLKQAPLTMVYPYIYYLTIRNWTDYNSCRPHRGEFSTMVLRRFFAYLPNVKWVILEGPIEQDEDYPAPLRFIPRSVSRLVFLMPFNTTSGWIFRNNRRRRRRPVYFTNRQHGFQLIIKGDLNRAIKFLSSYTFHPVKKLTINPVEFQRDMNINQITSLFKQLSPSHLSISNYFSRHIYAAVGILGGNLQALILKGPANCNLSTDSTLLNHYKMTLPNVRYIYIANQDPIGYEWYYVFYNFATFFPNLLRMFFGKRNIEPILPNTTFYNNDKPRGLAAIEWSRIDDTGERVSSYFDVEKFRLDLFRYQEEQLKIPGRKTVRFDSHVRTLGFDDEEERQTLNSITEPLNPTGRHRRYGEILEDIPEEEE